ncbi:MAG: hypothetical protein ACRC30_08825 [Clostridium sp.]
MIILILLGTLLIVLNIDKLGKTRESEFSKIILEKEKSFDKTNLEIGKIRKNMGESLTDIQLEIDELRKEIEILKKDKSKNIEEKQKKVYNEMGNDIINDIDFTNTSKKEKVKKLILEGKTDEDICTLLNASKGEVLLIRGLLK